MIRYDIGLMFLRFIGTLIEYDQIDLVKILRAYFMEIRPIQTKKDYLTALSKIEKLWNAPPKSLDSDRLEVLSLLVEQYEKIHYPIYDPDPMQLSNDFVAKE